MSEETKDPKTMTGAEAYRLKHQLGQSITWGNSNLNALQVEELTKLSKDDYARIRAEYRDWQKRLTVIPTYVLLLLMASCAVAYYFFANGWVRVAAIIIGITCFGAAYRREGHAEGYIDGYEAGHDVAIYKALGIKPEEVAEMREFATDMKIDDMVVKGMNEREKVSE